MRVTSELEACIRGDSAGMSAGSLRKCFGKFSAAVRGGQLHQDSKRTFYYDLPLRNPRLASRIAGLGSEHARITSELDALVEAVGALRETPDKPLRQRMARLIADLRQLDNDETAILQSAYWRENGVGD